MKVGSLFSGTGALDLAVEHITGAQPAWFVEFDPAPSKILAHHWPQVPNYGDVTQVRWEDMPPVDIITGGSPCQDLSAAGKRAGMTEGTRSNLWVNMRESINIIRPKLVVWENVLGALSATAASDSDMEPGEGPLGDGGGGHLRALGRVLGDLAEIGYDAAWTTLRASDVGAPHHRARVFLIGWPQEVSDPEGWGWDYGQAQDQWAPYREVHPPRDDRDFAADAEDNGRNELSDSAVRNEACSGWFREPPGGDRCKTSADTTDDGRERTRPARQRGTGPADGHNRTVEWREYAPAVRRWERIVGPAPAPTEPNTKGNPRLTAAFAEWLMGLPAGWITDVPGLSRADQLKVAGNGVVPQQAAAALTQLLEMFNQEKESA